MAFSFGDLLGWQKKIWRLAYPLTETATRITPTTLVPQDDFTATLHWISTGAATEIYRNGIRIAELAPTTGAATCSIPIQTNQCIALDIFELPGTTHPQPEPFETPTLSFDPVVGADGYRVYYGDTPDAQTRICDITSTTTQLPIRLYGGWGKTYYFRAETMDGRQISFPGTHDAIPQYLAVSLPGPPELTIASTANGIQIRGTLDTVADYPGFVPHAITAEVWSDQTRVTTATLTTDSPSATLTLADGSYSLRTRQSGGPWTELFDRAERTLRIESGMLATAFPSILTSSASMSAGRLVVEWTATETDANYDYGIWIPPNTVLSSPDIRIRRGGGDYEMDIPLETPPELVILAPLDSEGVGSSTTILPTPYPSRPKWQYLE